MDFDSLGEVDGPELETVREYRIITDDDDTDAPVHPASDVLKDFAQSVAAKLSSKSAERYFRGMKPLVAYLDIQKDVQNPIDADKSDLSDYLDWLMNTDWSRNTRKSRLAALQKFYSWAGNEDRVEENVAENISINDYRLETGDLEDSRRKTATDDDYKWIPRDDVRLLWQREHIPSPMTRNEMIIKLMWQTTCRCAAIANIKLDDVDRDNARIKIKNLKKGDDQADYRWVFYNRNKIEPLLTEWLDNGRRKVLGPYGTDSDYLFLTHQKPQMRSSHISRIVKDAAHNVNDNPDAPDVQEVAGYDVAGNPRWMVTGHTIRHSAATYFANQCPSVDIHFLKDQMGHQQLETTMKYVHKDPEARKRAFERAWK